MKFVLKIAEFIKKLQGLPEEKKKMILWTVVVILGLAMLFFWIGMSAERLGKMNTEEIIKPFDDLMEKSQIPNENEIPNIQDSEDMKELEKLLQEQ